MEELVQEQVFFYVGDFFFIVYLTAISVVV